MKKIIVAMSIFIVLFLLYNIGYKEKYMEPQIIQVVIARYNEDLAFLFEYPFTKYEIICYDKGVKEPESGYPPNCKVVKLPNVGRCDHTYLYHMIDNYNNLRDVTIFLPASCTTPEKIDLMRYVVHEAGETKNTVLTHRSDDDYIKGFENFYLDFYQGINPENLKINTESKLLLSPLRPFGEWYKHNFPELDGIPIHYVCYRGIFAVSRKDILKNPIDKYKKLISYLDTHSNPEAGHYIERSWGALFYKEN